MSWSHNSESSLLHITSNTTPASGSQAVYYENYTISLYFCLEYLSSILLCVVFVSHIDIQMYKLTFTFWIPIRIWVFIEKMLRNAVVVLYRKRIKRRIINIKSTKMMLRKNIEWKEEGHRYIKLYSSFFN